MKLIKSFLIAVVMISSADVFAKGGDDAGNGGFAYKQSIKILQMATSALENKIQDSTINDLMRFPERRDILQRTLKYENLKKWYLWVEYRDGQKLEMNYSVKDKTVTILKPYYQAFAGKTDRELEDASLEVQKRLLHEAAHIWGYKEEESEVFAIAFLNNVDDNARRPTNSIEIKNDFCSCINGKSDIINSCDNFCASKPITDQPILYANVNPGAEVLANPKLENLYNWCTVQLANDESTPQCVLNATDGTNTLNIPVNVIARSNSFSANILSLAKNRTWLLKLVEVKTGSNAQSKDFQIRRKDQQSGPTIGAIKTTPVSQYTCMSYGGKVDSAGEVIRTNYARQYYYFAANETPAPMPPVVGESLVVCHDEQIHPGNDSALYPRLELVSGIYTMFDKTDSRFVQRPEGKLEINNILEQRLYSEYNIQATLSLFNLINFPNRPSSNTSPVGYILVPFTDTITGKTFCPTDTDYKGNSPIFNLLGEYMSDTQGLYVSESEGVIIQDGTSYKTIYTTQFATEATLKNYGFYVENGLKVKADESSLHSKTIYYYWPVSKVMDPLIQGGRKLFTIRTYDSLSGQMPTGTNSGIRTTDKRIGCVPKGWE